MTFNRFSLTFAFVLALVPAVASAKRKADGAKEAPMSAPQYVVPQTQINLADFGSLVRAYTASMGDRRIVVVRFLGALRYSVLREPLGTKGFRKIVHRVKLRRQALERLG